MQLHDIALPDDLLWVNEFDHNPVAQSTERTLTGGLLIQEQAKRYGRSIILVGESSGWVRRSTVLALYALAETPNQPVQLTVADGRIFTVVFDREQGSPITATPILPSAYPQNEDWYSLKIQLLVVEG